MYVNVSIIIGVIVHKCNCELRLLFSLKPKEMAKMKLLAIWIDQR